MKNDTIWVRLAKDQKGDGLIGRVAEGDRKGKIVFIDFSPHCDLEKQGFEAGNFFRVGVKREMHKAIHVYVYAPTVAYPGPLEKAKESWNRASEELGAALVAQARKRKKPKIRVAYDDQGHPEFFEVRDA